MVRSSSRRDRSTAASSFFKRESRKSRLTNDGPQCASTQFPMKRDWNRGGSFIVHSLHNDVATSLANVLEAVLRENDAHIITREDAQLTHRPPQAE